MGHREEGAQRPEGGDPGAIDAAIVAGYQQQPASESDVWVLVGAIAAIQAEPW